MFPAILLLSGCCQDRDPCSGGGWSILAACVPVNTLVRGLPWTFGLEVPYCEARWFVMRMLASTGTYLTSHNCGSGIEQAVFAAASSPNAGSGGYIYQEAGKKKISNGFVV